MTDQEPKPTIREYQSFSSLITFVGCGMQYYYRYCEGIKTPPSVALIEGSAGHKGQEKNFVQKVDTHIDLPMDVILDVVSDSFEARKSEVENWEDNEPGKAKDGMITLMRHVHSTHNPTIQPVECEAEHIIEIPTESGMLKMKSYIDLVDSTKTIRDSKFTRKAKSQGDADNDMQLTIYSYCLATEQVAFDCFIKGSKPRVATIKSIRGPRQWNWLERAVPKYIKAIESGVFMPCDPSHWRCSERFCGYWFICPHGGKDTKKVIIDQAPANLLAPETEISDLL